MRRYLTLLIASIFLLIPSYSSAQPQAYSYMYNVTNLYYSYELQYEFTGLDADTEYTFSIQQVSDTNNPVKIFQNFVVSGVTTYSFEFAEFPSDVFTPFRVIDNFGRVLGQHYLAPLPDLEWFSSTGTNPLTSKIGIDGAPYSDINEFGYHQPLDDVDSVTTQHGNYTLLHYITFAPTNQFATLNIVGGAELYEFSLEDFTDFNCGVGWVECGLSFMNYVVLDTVGGSPDALGYGYESAGTIRPFISLVQDALITRGDNPHRASISTGVYEYAKTNNADLVLAVGESLWLVSNVASEFDATVNPATVLIARDVRARLFQNTPNIWAGLSVITLTDENEGLVTDDFSVFQTVYTVTYATSNSIAETDVVITWRHEAGTLNYGDSTEFYFDTLASYNIVVVASLENKLENAIIEAGLDSLFGRTIVLVIAIVTGSVLIFQNGLPSVAFKFVFLSLVIATMWLDWYETYIDVLLSILLLLVTVSLFNIGSVSRDD